MSLFSFFNFLTSDKRKKISFDPTECVPAVCDGDYCQIELVPAENRYFIQKQLEKGEDLRAKSRDHLDSTATSGRASFPITTVSKEIRVDSFEEELTGFGFQKAIRIRYNQNEVVRCETGSVMAFGSSNFTIFFDKEGEFVKNIWVNIGLIVSGPQLDLLRAALYNLGQGYELVLIAWNSKELFDLADRNQVRKFLMDYWK